MQQGLLRGVLPWAPPMSRGRGAGQGDREHLDTRDLSSHVDCKAEALSFLRVAYRMGCGERRMMSESGGKPQRAAGAGDTWRPSRRAIILEFFCTQKGMKDDLLANLQDWSKSCDSNLEQNVAEF